MTARPAQADALALLAAALDATRSFDRLRAESPGATLSGPTLRRMAPNWESLLSQLAADEDFSWARTGPALAMVAARCLVEVEPAPGAADATVRAAAHGAATRPPPSS